MTAPGWYNANNDPPGTVRYWDGVQWIGDPVVQPNPVHGDPNAGGYVPAPTADGLGPAGTILAKPGSRIGARAIDFVIGSALFTYFIVSDIGGSAGFPRTLGGGGYSLNLNGKALDTSTEFLVLGVFLITWHTLWTHLAGGTPGKLLTGIRVADAVTGEAPVSLFKAALRSLNYLNFVVIAASLSLNEPMAGVGLLIGFVSLILLATDAKNRTVMDHVARTVVIKRNRS